MWLRVQGAVFVVERYSLNSVLLVVGFVSYFITKRSVFKFEYKLLRSVVSQKVMPSDITCQIKCFLVIRIQIYDLIKPFAIHEYLDLSFFIFILYVTNYSPFIGLQ